MPKRQNPFDDVAPLQYKTHVRCKEVELGDKTKMRAIFGTWNFPFYNIDLYLVKYPQMIHFSTSY